MKKPIIFLLFITFILSAQAQELGIKMTQFDWANPVFDFSYTEAGTGETKTVKLTDEAKTTDHIIALLRAVYVNADIPGIRYAYMWRNPETGELLLNRKMNFRYNYTSHSDRSEYPNGGGGNPNNTWARSLDKNAGIVVPEETTQDGMTVMLVQLKESWTEPWGAKFINNARKTIDTAYSSVKVVTAFTRVHDVYNPGYLFAIDGAATNKFFFISKGKSRGCSASPLYRLYEQISPVKGDAGTTTNDFVSKMKSGEVYYCFHDCVDVATYFNQRDENNRPIGHWFTISDEGEAYSLKNLCLYVPDRRLENERKDMDPVLDELSSYDDQAKYYTNYGVKDENSTQDSIIRPKVFMYTADLNAEAVPSDVEDHYQVNLDWITSLTDQKVGAHVPEHYYVYIVQDDGSWVRIDDLLGENEPVEAREGHYLVPQTYETQVFHYVITAHPINYDMDGNMIMDGMDTLNVDCEKPLVTITAVSPVRTVVIPPLGKPFFQRLLEYRSFYNVNTEENFYRNMIAIGPANEAAFEAIKHFKGTYSVTRTDPDGQKETIAQVNISQKTGEIGFHYQVDYVDETQRDVANALFDNGNIVTEGVVTTATDNMVIYDRFRASTEVNEQYDHYIYNFEQMEMEGHGGEAFEAACSNPLTVPVFKTTNAVETEGYTRDEVLADREHTLQPRPTNMITFTAGYDPTANLVEYDVMRVNREYHPVDEYKVGKAENFNNSGEYHVIGIGAEGYLNYLEQTVNIGYNDDPQAITFIDKYGSVAEPVSSYVPTITTLFGGDLSKMNTYGCNILDMSYPQLNLSISAEKSNSFKQMDADGNFYLSKGYTARLNLVPMLTDEMNYAYYYRVWRVVDGEETEVLLNELDDFGGTGTSAQTGGPSYWQAIYSSIQETYPGENPLDVCDIIVKPYTQEEDDDFEVTYIARLYATYIEGYTSDVIVPDHNRRIAEHGGKDYVVVEQRATVNFKNVPTYLEEMYGTMINNVTYYNLQGISSDKPFKGMNIVVTRYSNGKVTTEKKMM